MSPGQPLSLKRAAQSLAVVFVIWLGQAGALAQLDLRQPAWVTNNFTAGTLLLIGGSSSVPPTRASTVTALQTCTNGIATTLSGGAGNSTNTFTYVMVSPSQLQISGSASAFLSLPGGAPSPSEAIAFGSGTFAINYQAAQATPFTVAATGAVTFAVSPSVAANNGTLITPAITNAVFIGYNNNGQALGTNIVYTGGSAVFTNSGVIPPGSNLMLKASLVLEGPAVQFNNALASTCTISNAATLTYLLTLPPMVSLFGAGSHLTLSWSTNYSSFTPQYSTNLANAAAWQTLGGGLSVSNGMEVIDLGNVTGRQVFYRLKK